MKSLPSEESHWIKLTPDSRSKFNLLWSVFSQGLLWGACSYCIVNLVLLVAAGGWFVGYAVYLSPMVGLTEGIFLALVTGLFFLNTLNVRRYQWTIHLLSLLIFLCGEFTLSRVMAHQSSFFPPFHFMMIELEEGLFLFLAPSYFTAKQIAKLYEAWAQTRIAHPLEDQDA